MPLEPHTDRAGEGVVLQIRVLASQLDQLGGEGAEVRGQAIVVAGAQLDDEVVRDERAVAADDLRVVVEFALDGSRDLDGLDLGPESPGERALNEVLEPALEALQNPHGYLPPRVSLVPPWQCP